MAKSPRDSATLHIKIPTRRLKAAWQAKAARARMSLTALVILAMERIDVSTSVTMAPGPSAEGR